MKDMVKNSETYAIAALPCAIRGFRLLQVKYPSLGKRIKVLIGLTCGHTVNGHYASAILKLTKNKDKETRRDIIADIWSKYFFSSSACLQCKDIFAEYSHISFMDDTGGSSVVIVRDPCMKALLEEEVKSGYAHLLPIDEQNIIDLRAQEIILKKLDGNKKYLFIFNRWLSNVLYSRRKHGKAMGLQILKAYIIILRKIQHNSFLRKLLNGKKA